MKLGKTPAVIDPRTLKYGTFRSTRAPAAPESAHWGHDLPYGPLGNVDWGDCVEAGAGHQFQVWDDRAEHPFVPTDEETLAAYSAIAGFDENAGPPGENPTDQGTSMLAACKYWRSTGYAGRKIDSFLSVHPSQTTFVKESIAFYGGLYIGAALPLSAQDQTGGGVWEVTTGPNARPGSWGGHCVVLTGYNKDIAWCVTWGALQPMTWGFLETYCDEAYTLLSRDWLETTGQSPSGLTWGQLEASLANL